MAEPALVEGAAGVAVPRPWAGAPAGELERLRGCIRKGAPFGGNN